MELGARYRDDFFDDIGFWGADATSVGWPDRGPSFLGLNAPTAGASCESECDQYAKAQAEAAKNWYFANCIEDDSKTFAQCESESNDVAFQTYLQTYETCQSQWHEEEETAEETKNEAVFRVNETKDEVDRVKCTATVVGPVICSVG